MSGPGWDTAQWVAFGGTLLALLGAITLVGAAVHAVRSWTAPALLVPAASASLPRDLRPTLHTAVRRRALDMTMGTRAMGDRLRNALTGEFSVVHPSLTSGPDVADALQPGVGSLAALPAADPAMLTAAERAAELEAWIHADDGAIAAALDAALLAFRAAVEPAMRKARLWELRGEEGTGGTPSHRAELARWRIDMPTGEYPMILALAP